MDSPIKQRISQLKYFNYLFKRMFKEFSGEDIVRETVYCMFHLVNVESNLHALITKYQDKFYELAFKYSHCPSIMQYILSILYKMVRSNSETFQIFVKKDGVQLVANALSRINFRKLDKNPGSQL